MFFLLLFNSMFLINYSSFLSLLLFSFTAVFFHLLYSLSLLLSFHLPLSLALPPQLPHVWPRNAKTFTPFEVYTWFHNFISAPSSYCIRIFCVFSPPLHSSLFVFAQTPSPVNTFFRMALGQMVQSIEENVFLISVKLMHTLVYQMCKHLPHTHTLLSK